MAPLGRLTRRSEFLRTAAARQKWVTPGLILQARPRCGDPDPTVRMGLTVSRKVGNAVTRNRARRRLRALGREILPECGRPGMDYVLIGRAATPKRPASELRHDLETAVEKLNRRLDKAAAKRCEAAPAANTDHATPGRDVQGRDIR